MLSKPAVQLLTRGFGHLDETYASASSSINPCNLGFGFERHFAARQSEKSLREAALRKLAAEENCHTAFAQIGCCGLEFLALAKDESDGHFYRLPEIPAALPRH